MMEIGRAIPPDIPLRPDNLEFVRPGFGVKVGKAGSLSSRIAILHALANVEQWAIDTALDNMARFGYYGKAFGAGSSSSSSHSTDEKNTIPSNIIEDDADDDLYEFRQVTPAYAQREDDSQGKEEEMVDPVEAQRRKRFQEVVVQYFKGSLKPPFNTVDREKGGLTRGWYEPLVVVRERTGFKPGAGRRLQNKKEVKGEGSSQSAANDQTGEGVGAGTGAEAGAGAGARGGEGGETV
ncbi:hypothetical protein BGZ65_001966, partial [Modicella reniformis]